MGASSASRLLDLRQAIDDVAAVLGLETWTQVRAAISSWFNTDRVFAKPYQVIQDESKPLNSRNIEL